MCRQIPDRLRIRSGPVGKYVVCRLPSKEADRVHMSSRTLSKPSLETSQRSSRIGVSAFFQLRQLLLIRLGINQSSKMRILR